MSSGYGRPRRDRLGVQPARSVGRPHQRAGQHSGEAEALGELLMLDELLGFDPALHGVVAQRRPQVLRDGDDVAAGVVEIVQRGAHLVGSLAHAEDQVGLGDKAIVPGRGQHGQAALVAERGPDPLEDSRHRFDVVRQHFWACLEDLLEQLRFAVEVRDQQLDAGVGIERFDGPDGFGVQPRATVGQVVAGNARDGGVAQPHRLHALGDAAWLVAVERGGFTGVDLAEVAAPGALLAADQEGGLAVLPALEDVRAAGFLTDRVQPFAPDQGLEFLVLRAHLGASLDPRWLALDRRLGVADLETQQLSTFRSDRHYVNATTSRPSSASHTASATGPSTSATATGLPSSAVSDVTPAANASRSQSQLSAKPCSVVARDTRMPMAPILRAGRRPSDRTHTPERPSTRPVSRPSPAHTLIIDSSRRRTKFTTSSGSARPMIG